MPVGPAVTRPDPQREDSAIFDLEILQNVGHEVQVFIVSDQTRIAVNDDHANILRIPHEHPDLAPVPTRLPLHAVKIYDAGLDRYALLQRRQRLRCDLLFQVWRLDETARGCR